MPSPPPPPPPPRPTPTPCARCIVSSSVCLHTPYAWPAWHRRRYWWSSPQYQEQPPRVLGMVPKVQGVPPWVLGVVPTVVAPLQSNPPTPHQSKSSENAARAVCAVQGRVPTPGSLPPLVPTSLVTQPPRYLPPLVPTLGGWVSRGVGIRGVGQGSRSCAVRGTVRGGVLTGPRPSPLKKRTLGRTLGIFHTHPQRCPHGTPVS